MLTPIWRQITTVGDSCPYDICVKIQIFTRFHTKFPNNLVICAEKLRSFYMTNAFIPNVGIT